MIVRLWHGRVSTAKAVALVPIRFWMGIAAVHGVMVLVGVFMTIRHLLTLKAAPAAAPA